MARSKRWALAGAGVIGVLAGAGVATGAGAVAAGAAAVTVTRSTRLAGYVATGALASLSSSVVVPALSCPGTGTFTADLSTQLYGAAGGGTFIRLRCAAGVASYSGTVGWATGGSRAFAVAPGDTIVSDVTVKPSGASMIAVAKVTDVTTKVITRRAYKLAAGTETSGYFVVQDVGRAAIPPFGRVTWSGVTVNGGTLASASPTRYVLANAAKKTLVSTSAIGTTGESFTNGFVASS